MVETWEDAKLLLLYVFAREFGWSKKDLEQLTIRELITLVNIIVRTEHHKYKELEKALSSLRWLSE